MAAPARSINLLPKSEFETSFWGKFLQWAITSGRYIIVAVEAIVILAFLSRFKLDQDVANLTAEITGNQRILLSLAPQEKQFREVQARLDTTKIILGSQLHSAKLLDDVVSALPEDIKLTSISVKRTTIEVEGTTFSEAALGRMLVALGKHTEWRGMDLTNLSTNNGTIITFGLTITR